MRLVSPLKVLHYSSFLIFKSERDYSDFADVSAFSQQQVCMNSSYIQIFDLLKPVVVYFICFITAAGADMLTARLLYLYIAAILIFIHIFYDYIFQSQQFCCIIFHRAYKFLSLMLSHLHCKGFLCYALLLFLLFSHKLKVGC